MTNEMNKIADKIQKLFALAGNNPSEDEANEALLKAQALMVKYGLEKSDIHNEEKVSYSIEMTKAKSHRLNNDLAGIIANSFACRVLIKDGKIGFFGYEHNAKAAAPAMEFAFKVMVKGGNKATRDNGVQPGHKGAAKYYNSYVIGFIAGIKASMDAQTRELAIVVPKDVDDEMSSRFNVIPYKSKNIEAGTDYDSYTKGFADGKATMQKRQLT